MRKAALVVVLLCCFQIASAFSVPSVPSGYINDYANIISADVKQQLEEKLRLFAASTTNEIAVVTVPDLSGDTIENYAVKLFESWKIGNAKNDNGVLLLVSSADRRLRIEVGYGLEGALPDILTKSIIDTQITPSFKEGNYSRGISQGVHAIVEATQGEYVARGSTSKSTSSLPSLYLIFIVGFFIIQFLSSIFARSKSWWAGGVLGGITGAAIIFFGIFGVTFIIGSIITTILILLGLLFDYIVSSAYTNSVTSGSSIPWWAGGGRGSSSGGSFGGFGGGRSGGGGSSGSW